MKFADVVFVYQLTQPNQIDWHTRHHTHESGQFEVHYFLNGEARFIQNKQGQAIEPGRLFITPPGKLHWIDAPSLDRPLSYYAVLFQLERNEIALRQFIQQTLLKTPHYALGNNYRYFFEELKEKAFSTANHRRQAAAHQFISLLYSLPDAQMSSLGGNVATVHIEKALKLMQDNIFSGISLSEIADRLELSEAHFIRLFKKKMHITPMRYMKRLKIDIAARLLRTSSRSLASIAEQLHFSSEFHLSKAFKQEKGMAPSLYRKQFRS